MVMLLKINNIDVTKKILNYRIERTFGYSVSSCTIESVSAIKNQVDLENGMDVLITEDNKILFEGNIESVEAKGPKVTIICKDKMALLSKMEIVYAYDKDVDIQAGKISEIFRDIVVRFGKLNAGKYGVDDDTVALYHFDELSGNTINDSTKHFYNGTANGTTIVPGKFLNSRSFNGSSDYISIPSSAINNLTIGTIEFWIKRNGGLGSQQCIIDKSSGSNVYFRAYIDTDDKIAFIFNDHLPLKTNFVFDDTSDYNHVAIRWDGSNIEIVVNGTIDAIYSLNYYIPDFNTQIYIGKTSSDTMYLNANLEEMRISDVFRDRLQYFDPIQDSGDTLTLSKFLCNHADPLERCKALAETLDWQFYYRPDTDAVYFEPLGFSSASSIIKVGNGGNVLKYPNWIVDNTEMINELTIIGAAQLVETTEKFSGDGVTTIFTLTKKPESVKVYVNGVLKTGGKPGASTIYDYTVDKEKKEITFLLPPPSGTNNIEIDYTYGIPTPVTGKNEASINQYGRYVKTIFLSDVVSVEDAEKRLNNMLNKYSNPFYKVIVIILDPNNEYQVGRKVRVVDEINGYDVYLIVNKYTKQYPEKYNEIELGDKQWRTEEWGARIEEKIHRLEEQETKTQDLLLHLQSIDLNVYLSDIQFKRDSITIMKRDIIPNRIILGHPDFEKRRFYNQLGPHSGSYSVIYQKTY